MIQLTTQQQRFVDGQVSAGVFNQPADVVGAALELLQARQCAYSRLTAAIVQVERSEYEPLDIEDVKRRGRSGRPGSNAITSNSPHSQSDRGPGLNL